MQWCERCAFCSQAQRRKKNLSGIQWAEKRRCLRHGSALLLVQQAEQRRCCLLPPPSVYSWAVAQSGLVLEVEPK